MTANRSIQFFDKQFQEQARNHDLQLNPFELIALPYLRGRVLDYGCGMGNLACAVAERGCSVLALDASPAAIAHLQHRAATEELAIQAELADLRDYVLHDEFDAVVSIGLLMFFDCATAFKTLSHLQARVRRGGVAVINVLVEGTTYLDMFDASHYCLASASEIENRFSGWKILQSESSRFEAPGGTTKVFVTIVAEKPRAGAMPQAAI